MTVANLGVDPAEVNGGNGLAAEDGAPGLDGHHRRQTVCVRY